VARLLRVPEDEPGGFIVKVKVRVKGCGVVEPGAVVVQNVRLARRLEAWVLFSGEGGLVRMEEGVEDVPHLSCTLEELTATIVILWIMALEEDSRLNAKG
jgi:hypothetical protein